MREMLHYPMSHLRRFDRIMTLYERLVLPAVPIFLPHARSRLPPSTCIVPITECQHIQHPFATSLRYQVKMVSGFARAATSAGRWRPKRCPISPSVARSASESFRRPCNRSFRMRFSAARLFVPRYAWAVGSGKGAVMDWARILAYATGTSLIAQKLYRTVCGVAILAVDNSPSCRPFQFFDHKGSIASQPPVTWCTIRCLFGQRSTSCVHSRRSTGSPASIFTVRGTNPGTFIANLPVDLPRPRPKDVCLHPACLELKRQSVELIREQTLVAFSRAYEG
jgi:hypothetical protein